METLDVTITYWENTVIWAQESQLQLDFAAHQPFSVGKAEPLSQSPSLLFEVSFVLCA